MSTQLNKQDLDEAIEIAIDMLSKSNDAVESAVFDIILPPRTTNIDRTFATMLSTIIEYVNEFMWESKRQDMFASDDVLEDAIGVCIRVACDAFAIDQRLDDLFDTDEAYEDACVNADKYVKMDREINGGSSRGRGRDSSRSRDTGRSARGRDTGRGRDSSRNRDTGRSARGRTSRNDTGRKTASANYRDNDADTRTERNSRTERPARGRTERPERKPHVEETTKVDRSNVSDIRSGRRAKQAEKVEVPETVELTNVDVDTVYDYSSFGIYINEVDEHQLVTHEDAAELNMEEYVVHELGKNAPTAKDTSIVPIADIRKIKDPAIDDVLEDDAKPVVVYPELIRINSPLVELPASAFAPLTANGNEYQVAQFEVTTHAILDSNLVAAVNKELMDITKVRTFTDIYTWFEMALEKCATLPSVKRFISYNTLQELNFKLTGIFNDALVIVGSKATIEDFNNDFHSAYNWLLSPEQKDKLAIWNEIEDLHIKANVTLSYKQVSEDDNGEDTTLDVKTKVYGVMVSGNMRNIVSTGGAPTAGTYKPSTLVYDKAPAFYNACAKLVSHRKGSNPMAPIILCDGTGSQYKLYAGNGLAPVMRLMKYK